jgi:hypothetical protein
VSAAESCPRTCQFCRERGSTYFRAPEVFQYGVRHYAHAWCLARNKGCAENARDLIHDHQRALFDKALAERRAKVAALVRERFREWNGLAALTEDDLEEQLEDRLPGLGGIEVYRALRDVGAVPSEEQRAEHDNETVTVYRLATPKPLRINPTGRRRHDLANAIVATATKGTPVIVLATEEQERALRKLTEKFLTENAAPVTYERKKGRARGGAS